MPKVPKKRKRNLNTGLRRPTSKLSGVDVSVFFDPMQMVAVQVGEVPSTFHPADT